MDIPTICALHLEPALSSDAPEDLALALKTLRQTLRLIAPDTNLSELHAVADMVAQARLNIAAKN